MLLSDTQTKGGVVPPVAASNVGLDSGFALCVLAVPSSAELGTSIPEQETNCEERLA